MNNKEVIARLDVLERDMIYIIKQVRLLRQDLIETLDNSDDIE